MRIIVDHRIEADRLEKLKEYGEVLLFPKSEDVYEAISSHPDIFLFQKDDFLIVAPNTPKAMMESLYESKVNFSFGKASIGFKYPETAYYNAAYKDGLLICNLNKCDDEVKNACKNDKRIHSNQGYARCNHLILDQQHVLSSDLPTVKLLKDALYVDPRSIQLVGFEHGFFGGCCGIFNKTIFVNGSLDHLKNGDKIVEYIENASYQIVELSKGAMQDIGSIFFIP